LTGRRTLRGSGTIDEFGSADLPEQQKSICPTDYLSLGRTEELQKTRASTSSGIFTLVRRFCGLEV
jgi:hypothetical protein